MFKKPKLMNSAFLEILKFSKLDLTDSYLTSSCGTSLVENNFEISPRAFLRFAKEDLNQGIDRGYINSITNSKRAIDCQIDETLEKLLGSSNDFNPLVKEFLKYFEFETDIPIKLRAMNALNLAPSLLISKSRTLRNKLEHMYKNPEVTEVKEALDVADLFIRSVTGKFSVIWSEFEISDGKGNQINIEFSPEERTFKFKVLNNNGKDKDYFINTEKIEYLGFLRLMFSIDDEIEINSTFKVILKQIGHPIPPEKINIWLHD